MSQQSDSLSELVKTLEVFNFFSEEDTSTIEKYMFRFEYGAGSFVFRAGTHGGYMFFIVEGAVETIKQFDEKTHVIAELGPSRSVGEMSLIDGVPRSASVRAKDDLSLIVLKNEGFRKLLDEHPAIANKVLMGMATLLSASLRETNKVFTEKLLSIV